ncbi:MAG TPA: hypothetical protein VL026_01065 [Rhizomicrobium sp.]|nr:hypothetical protein [Rhizomicrobium sp.]
MSELINTCHNGHDLRWHLLTTASAFALLTSVIGQSAHAAEDSDRPTVWIELGGQLERIDTSQTVFAPGFVLTHETAPFNAVSPLTAQRLPRYGFGGEGKITFAPTGSDWALSAAIRYGRSNGKKALHQQTTTNLVQKTWKYDDPIWGHHAFTTRKVTRFNRADAAIKQSHAVLDFMAGKDVGLGSFGRNSASSIGLGVRIAQFQSKSNIGFKSFPDPHYSTQAFINDPGAHHHSYVATLEAERNFRGIGPAIAWNASAPIAGQPDSTVLDFDWGANAALLFGRTKAHGAYSSSSRYFHGSPFALPPPLTDHTTAHGAFARSKSVIVPNVGGFAGLTLQRANAKVSFGYRADFFFGAMDGGLDSKTKENVIFHGPFAKISVGLGG